MNVKVNDTLYEDVQWSGSMLTIQGDMSIADAEAAMSPGDTVSVISVFEGDEETQRYYNKGISSMRVTKYEGQPRQIEIEFITSKIEKNVEDALQEDIDSGADAILALSAMFSEFESAKERWNSMADVIDAHAKIIQKNVDTLDSIMSLDGPLVMLEDRINDLCRRIGIQDETPSEDTEHSMVVPTSADAGQVDQSIYEGMRSIDDPEPEENADEPIAAEGTVEEAQ